MIATRAQRVGASHVTQLLAVGCRTQHWVHHVSQPVHPEKREAVDTMKEQQRGVGGGWGVGGDVQPVLYRARVGAETLYGFCNLRRGVR